MGINIEQVKECGNLSFTPPWRKGRTATKIKKLLRGQQVPLHLRGEACVLCVTGASLRGALAVYVEGGNGDDRWIVNAEFFPRDGLPVTNIIVGKTSPRIR